MTTDARSGRQRIRLTLLRAAGAAYRRSSRPVAPRSILLIRPDHLGDMLFLTPALHALRQALPAPGSRCWADRGALRPCAIPRTWTPSRPASSRGLSDSPRRTAWRRTACSLLTARKLRGADYDTAVILRFDHWWGTWLAAAAGIPRRIGYDWPETRSFLTQTLPYRSDRHEVEQNATLLAELAAGDRCRPGRDTLSCCGGRPRLGYRLARGRGPRSGNAWSRSTRARARRSNSGRLRCGLLWPTGWPSALTSGSSLTGGPGERELVGSIATRLAHPALNAAGATTLGQLAALYCALRSRARLRQRPAAPGGRG